jgi:hypothetical protein
MPIISFLIIGFALEAVMCYGISLYMINCSKNTLFSRNAVTFSIQGTAMFDFGDIDDVSIFRTDDNTAFSAYEIVCSDGRLNVGSGIKTDKALLGTNSAIVGSEVGSFADLSELIIDDKKYEIKGEFTDKRVPSNNCTVFYFGNSICEVKNSEFVIDGKNKKHISSALELLNNKAAECGAEIHTVENNKVGVRNFISSKKTLPILFIMYFIVLGFNDVMICIFHTEQLKRIITVNVLLGKKRPVSIIFRSLLFFMLISSAASAFVVWLIMGQSMDAVYSFIATVVFLGVINTVISMIYKYKLINNSSELLMELCNE